METANPMFEFCCNCNMRNLCLTQQQAAEAGYCGIQRAIAVKPEKPHPTHSFSAAAIQELAEKVQAAVEQRIQVEAQIKRTENRLPLDFLMMLYSESGFALLDMLSTLDVDDDRFIEIINKSTENWRIANEH